MPDRYLIGNGRWCSSCCPDGAPEDTERWRFRRGCNECAGNGRVALSEHEIVEATLAEARKWRREKQHGR
jgi:hypothetical protein